MMPPTSCCFTPSTFPARVKFAKETSASPQPTSTWNGQKDSNRAIQFMFSKGSTNDVEGPSTQYVREVALPIWQVVDTKDAIKQSIGLLNITAVSFKVLIKLAFKKTLPHFIWNFQWIHWHSYQWGHNKLSRHLRYHWEIIFERWEIAYVEIRSIVQNHSRKTAGIYVVGINNATTLTINSHKDVAITLEGIGDQRVNGYNIQQSLFS